MRDNGMSTAKKGCHGRRRLTADLLKERTIAAKKRFVSLLSRWRPRKHSQDISDSGLVDPVVARPGIACCMTKGLLNHYR